jgi:hypothetical protein
MFTSPTPGVLLYAVVWVLLIALCVIALIRAMWAPLELYRRPCCGGCGHAVSDFLLGRCPECGGIYAKVGISTPSMAARLRGSLVLAILAWTTLSTLGVSYVYRLLEQRAYSGYQTAYAAATAPAPPQTRMSEGTSWDFVPDVSGRRVRDEELAAIDYRLTIRTDLITNRGKVESGTGTMELRRNGAPEACELIVTVGKGSYVLKDASGKELATGDSVDEAVVRRWYTAAELDTDHPVIRRGVADTLKLAGFIKSDPGALKTAAMRTNREDIGSLRFNGGGGGSRDYLPNPTPPKPPPTRPNGPDTGDVMIAGPIVLAFYVAGCWFIIWRHRRLVRGGAAAPASSAT